MKKLDIKGICHYLTNKKYKRIILMFVAVLLLNSLIATTTGTNVIKKSVNQVLSTLNNYTEEKKNITPLKSSGYDSEVGGSIKLEKSADWSGYKKAKININVDTIALTEDGKKSEQMDLDVIFVMDMSGSMSGNKIKQVKEDTKSLIDYVATNTNNQMSLVTFDTDARIVKPFTNNIDSLKNAIDTIPDTISIYNLTDYKKAYKTVDTLLEDYTVSHDRQLVMIFLTDGFPTSKGHKAEYSNLKEKYPDMIINGIQYELGYFIIKDVKDMTDYQYTANRSNLAETLFNIYETATNNLYNKKVLKYESFNIEDIITDDFEIESLNDIKVSIGTVVIEIVDGKQKVVWNLGEDSFKSGNKATMEINVSYKGETNEKGFFPTNAGTNINYKLPSGTEETITTEETPVLQNGYEVVYETNAPDDCHNILLAPSKEIHFFGEQVTKSTKELNCDNYIFQRWELAESTGTDIFKKNEETFTMPSHDVTYRGVWSTLNIAKSMEGEVASQAGNAPFDVSEAQSDSGIKFNVHSSYNNNGNGLYVYEGTENDEYPIYYYRGAVTNNNILFANYCWKIVRTTETGGIKLIYNGAPTSDNKCTNTTGTGTQIGTSVFNSSYNNARYVGYMYDNASSVAQHGDTESNIKKEIDAWFKTNIDDKGYTKYLEDTVWCNDRAIGETSGSAIYYKSYVRLWTNKERPKVKDEEVCTQQSDRYTLSGNSKGNGALTYPVGLLTADEAELGGMGIYADSGNTSNKTSYLYTGQYFWLLSPGHWNSSHPTAFYVSSGGHLFESGFFNSYGVRPSVSLNSDTVFANGDGSTNSPYKVE